MMVRDCQDAGRLVHLEADMYFTEHNGEYTFDPSKIKQAHEWCHTRAFLTLRQNKDVVVSNTFTQRWEYQPYIDLAAEYGVPFQVIEVHGNFANVHGVPPEAIQRMKARWEPYEDA
jgi:predicted kinase